MPDATGTDLPPRLSEQQQLALAAYVDGHDLSARHPERSAFEGVQRALRDEFGAARQSISRTVRRLEDRGLIERWNREGRRLDLTETLGGPRETRQIRLTDDGERVADEILRRCRDGRYALGFDTLDGGEAA